jgi:4'-phosphopantetheinyl transferase
MDAPRPGLESLDVYWFPLQASPEQCAAWRVWLSPEELRRADRFLDQAHGARYIAAHAHLRWILAQRLGCAPAEVGFTRAPSGKPRLAQGGLFFNLSHSHQLGLLGIHPSAEIGVDIEYQIRPRNWPGLAQRCFTAAECAWLEQQDPEGYAGHFCRLWTLKEAWMKADGRGLAGLHLPEVDFTPAGPRLTALGRCWFTAEAGLEAGYAAAVVTAEAARVSWTRLAL